MARPAASNDVGEQAIESEGFALGWSVIVVAEARAVLELGVVGAVADLEDPIGAAVVELDVIGSVVDLERPIGATVVGQLDFMAAATTIVARLRLASLSNRANSHGRQREGGNNEEHSMVSHGSDTFLIGYGVVGQHHDRAVSRRGRTPTTWGLSARK
jgi:hypothetical protein